MADTLQAAGAELSQQGQATAEQLESSVAGLSSTLANRVLGIDGASASGGSR